MFMKSLFDKLRGLENEESAFQQLYQDRNENETEVHRIERELETARNRLDVLISQHRRAYSEEKGSIKRPEEEALAKAEKDARYPALLHAVEDLEHRLNEKIEQAEKTKQAYFEKKAGVVGKQIPATMADLKKHSAEIKKCRVDIQKLESLIKQHEQNTRVAETSSETLKTAKEKRLAVLADLAQDNAGEKELKAADDAVARAEASRQEAARAANLARDTVTGLRARMEPLHVQLKALETATPRLAAFYIRSQAEIHGKRYAELVRECADTHGVLLALEQIIIDLKFTDQRFLRDYPVLPQPDLKSCEGDWPTGELDQAPPEVVERERQALRQVGVEL